MSDTITRLMALADKYAEALRLNHVFVADNAGPIRQALESALRAALAAHEAQPSQQDKIGYMDGTDWQHHVEHDVSGVSVYPSLDAALKHNECAKECGVVRVSIREQEWVMEQKDLSDRGTK